MKRADLKCYHHKKIIIWGDEYVDGFIKLTYCGNYFYNIYCIDSSHCTP